ncbi:hypothetical protein ACF0H5_010067 [Mactra antiquata]
MTMLRCFFLVFIFLFTCKDVYSSTVDGDSKDMVNKLLERIDRLESRLEASDAANKAMISEMKAKHDREVTDLTFRMNEMETSFNKRVHALENEIIYLKKGTVESHQDQTEQLVHGNEDTNRLVKKSNRIQQQESVIRTYREFPEQGVAFYATHTDHDIHHLGAQQILLFQQTHTNIGNAYNNNTGSFVAPVDGTYVLHATIMGIDTAGVSQNHFHAHFDINGVPYSKFYVTAYDQSSQMLVINLKAGQTVNVKNDITDAGFVGQHYSTFSGFLLYQNVPSGNIIGK